MQLTPILMTAHNILEKVADHYCIPVEALTDHSYKSNSNWKRVTLAKKQACFILAKIYSQKQIATMLRYGSKRAVKRNIDKVRVSITKYDFGFVEGLLSGMG